MPSYRKLYCEVRANSFGVICFSFSDPRSDHDPVSAFVFYQSPWLWAFPLIYENYRKHFLSCGLICGYYADQLRRLCISRFQGQRN